MTWIEAGDTDAAALAAGVRARDRRALARAITLVESTREDHRGRAGALLDALLPHTGGGTRVGISGAPGVGKSTLIEALGNQLVDDGHRVAVLAVDPSSTRSGGSILADKTRMASLARRAEAFIRPSPTAGTVGGVARRTREALLLCEAAGFDVVLVETVGVGQSETAVDALVDTFVLLVAPGAGDQLQGVKRGVMELADVVAVTKADSALEPEANRVAGDYRAAVQLLRPKHPGWDPPVVVCSAVTGGGVDDLWAAVVEHRRLLTTTQDLDGRRARQALEWMWTEVRERLLAELRSDPAVARALTTLEARVLAGETSAAAAAEEVLESFRRS